MAKLAVIRTGGKQFLVKENDVLYVDKIDSQAQDKIELEALSVFDDAGDSIELGTPTLSTKVSAEVVEQVKGDKIRVEKFKAKVRYRKAQGYRARLTKIKIISI